MFTKNHFINLTSLIFIAASGFLMMYFFSEEDHQKPVILALTYTAIFLFIFYKIDRIDLYKNKNILRKFIFYLIGIWSIAIMLIKFYLENHFKFNQILISNYLFSNVISIIALVVLIYIIFNSSKDIKELFVRSIILISHPAIYYLFLKRSIWFLILTAVISVMYFSIKYLNEKKINLNFIWILILLVFVTIAFYPFSIFISILIPLYVFRNDTIKIFITWILISAISISVKMIFLNSAWFDFIDLNFWNYFLIGVSIYIGWILSRREELYLAAAIFILLSSITYFTSEFETRKFILLLSTITPLFLFAIHNYKVDKFLGKVLK